MSAFRHKKVHFSGDQVFEGTDGIKQAGLDRSFGDASLSRDFLDFQILVESQHNDFAVFRGKFLERLGELGRAEILV